MQERKKTNKQTLVLIIIQPCPKKMPAFAQLLNWLVADFMALC